MISDVINMSRARDKEKMWGIEPMTYTDRMLLTLSYEGLEASWAMNLTITERKHLLNNWLLPHQVVSY